MKIGVLNNLYGAYSRGGAETVTAMMIADLKEAGADVFLITTKPKGKPADENLLKSGLKTYYLNSQYHDLGKKSLVYRLLWQIGNLFSLRKYWRIKKIFAQEHPDLIITHNLMGLGFMVPLAAKKLKIRHEHFLHDIQLIHPSGLMFYGKEKIIRSTGAKIYQYFTRCFFSSAAKIISPSRWLLEMHTGLRFFKDAEKEIRPFKWPADQGAADRDKKNNADGGANNFIFVGQIEESKGIFLLIEAFKEMAEPDLCLTIVARSEGGKIAEAKELAKGDARIKFLGPLTYEEAREEMKKSDCLITPSLCYENSPTIIYGAHSLGLPVIASRIGGIPEITDEKDKLFTPGDKENLKMKIREMTN